MKDGRGKVGEKKMEKKQLRKIEEGGKFSEWEDDEDEDEECRGKKKIKSRKVGRIRKEKTKKQMVGWKRYQKKKNRKCREKLRRTKDKVQIGEQRKGWTGKGAK